MGFKDTNYDDRSIQNIIFAYNIKDHEGKIYFPEVMWCIFYSTVGKSDRKMDRTKFARNLLKEIKAKYKELSPTLTMEQLCGNTYNKYNMTVTKYLAGITILYHYRQYKK